MIIPLEHYIDLIDELFYIPDLEDDEIHWAADPALEEAAIDEYKDAAILLDFHDYYFESMEEDDPDYMTVEQVLKKALKLLQDRDYYDLHLGLDTTSSNASEATASRIF